MQNLHYWDRLKKLSLMSLQRRRERFIILHMWKILNNQITNDLQIQFVIRPRLGKLAKIPPIKKTCSSANRSLYENSFAVLGPKLWNSIPYHLNVISNFNNFKNSLTAFLLAVPDKPPLTGYCALNTNSPLCFG